MSDPKDYGRDEALADINTLRYLGSKTGDPRDVHGSIIRANRLRAYIERLSAPPSDEVSEALGAVGALRANGDPRGNTHPLGVKMALGQAIREGGRYPCLNHEAVDYRALHEAWLEADRIKQAEPSNHYALNDAIQKRAALDAALRNGYANGDLVEAAPLRAEVARLTKAARAFDRHFHLTPDVAYALNGNAPALMAAHDDLHRALTEADKLLAGEE